MQSTKSPQLFNKGQPCLMWRLLNSINAASLLLFVLSDMCLSSLRSWTSNLHHTLSSFIFISPSHWHSLWKQVTTINLKSARPDVCICSSVHDNSLQALEVSSTWASQMSIFTPSCFFFYSLQKPQQHKRSDCRSQFRLNIIWQLIRLVPAAASPSSLSTLPWGN